MNGVTMDLDVNQSNRLNRLVAGVNQIRSGGAETAAITAAAADRATLWKFIDARTVISALGEHYGLDQATIWSHVMEGTEVDDVELRR